jgi:DNA-directed RNA polymerase specialized sigma24 family protein
MIREVGHGVGGLSVREVARVLGISHGLVVIIEARALAKLRKRLEARGYSFESFTEGWGDGR